MNHDELDRFIESPDGQRAIELSREFRTIMTKHNMLEGTVNGVGCNAMSLKSRLDSLQAKLDAVMLEYCAGDMTPEQIENWANHQRVVEKHERNCCEWHKAGGDLEYPCNRL